MADRETGEAPHLADGQPEDLLRHFTPPRLAPRIGALLAIRAEVLSIPTAVSETSVARVKLGWWREEIRRLVNGEPRHPHTVALMASTDDPTTTAGLAPLVDAAEDALEHVSVTDGPDFDRHAWLNDGCVFDTALALAGQSDAQARRRIAAPLARSVFTHRVLRQLPDLLRRERVYLPQDLLREHALARRDLRPDQDRSRLTPLLQVMSDRAWQDYERGRLAVADGPGDGTIVAAVVAQQHMLELAQMARTGATALDEGWYRPGVMRRLWSAWRTAGRALRGRSAPRMPRPRWREETKVER